ncbi:MAG: GNAT family N-acetyltransferase [Bacillaceae bacterium]|nr:GNAT family N-acetyltransferase [Bacillaceae bacterium]
MHYHPYYKDKWTSKSGIWEENWEVVAAIHNELGDGVAYLSFRTGYEYLFAEMIDHAEQHLAKEENRKCKLTVFANEFNEKLTQVLSEKDYSKADKDLQYHTICTFDMDQPFPKVDLPAGYTVMSLAEENNLKKVDRVLYRGFGHEGEPDEDGIEDRKLMQSAPNFRKDLNIVVVAPNGDYFSYAGFFLQEDIKVAYVEPVATDPDYRRLGIGSAAMLEGIRRCIDRGAKTVIVESAIPFYLSLGFQPQFIRHPWFKEFSK